MPPKVDLTYRSLKVFARKDPRMKNQESWHVTR